MPTDASQMVLDLLRLCHVPRWAVVPISRPQSVAEHSFRTAVIATYLSLNLQYVPSMGPHAVTWALMHDGDESVTGDIPSLVKTHIQGVVEPTWWRNAKSGTGDHVINVVKLADLIEAYTYAIQYVTHPARREALRVEYVRRIERYVTNEWPVDERASVLKHAWAVSELIREV